MTHKTNLYAGWWIYVGLAGLGLVLLLASYGGAYLWAALAVFGALAIVAIAAYATGRGPRVQAVTELSEAGVSLMADSDQLSSAAPPIPWEGISAVRVVPQPGFWEVQVQTAAQPDAWLPAGRGLELAEEIAEVAGLPYREDLNTPVSMGVEHTWTESGA